MPLTAWAMVAALMAASNTESSFVGASSCKTCHEEEYRQWQSTGHAMALARLSEKQQRDRVCRSCHTTDPADTSAALAGVQCESCHGSGRHYAHGHVMKDAVLSDLLGLKKVTPQTCALCHTRDGPSLAPFDYEKKIELVRHKKRSEEARTQRGNAPAKPHP